jgi:ribosomal protein S18 acetylase RimI-like enzyme
MMTEMSGIFSFTEIRSAEAIVSRRYYMNNIESLLAQLSPSFEPLTDERVDAMFASGTRMFVATAHSSIVGIVLLCRIESLLGTEDWIKNLVVDQNYRRQKVAGHLMDMAEQASHETGADDLNLITKPERRHALEFFEKRGYRHQNNRYMLQL